MTKDDRNEIRTLLVEVLEEILPVFFRNIPTKENLAGFATREDIRSIISRFDVIESKFKTIDSQFDKVGIALSTLLDLIKKRDEEYERRFISIERRLEVLESK